MQQLLVSTSGKILVVDTLMLLVNRVQCFLLYHQNPDLPQKFEQETISFTHLVVNKRWYRRSTTDLKKCKAKKNFKRRPRFYSLRTIYANHVLCHIYGAPIWDTLPRIPHTSRHARHPRTQTTAANHCANIHPRLRLHRMQQLYDWAAPYTGHVHRGGHDRVQGVRAGLGDVAQDEGGEDDLADDGGKSDVGEATTGCAARIGGSGLGRAAGALFVAACHCVVVVCFSLTLSLSLVVVGRVKRQVDDVVSRENGWRFSSALLWYL